LLAVAVLVGGLVWRLSIDPSTHGAAARGGGHHGSGAQGSGPPRRVTTTTTSDGIPVGYSTTDLVFSDDFSGTKLNSANWNTFVTSNGAHGVPWNTNNHGGSGLQNPALVANSEYYLPSQVQVDDGLTLVADETPTPGMLVKTPKTYPWRSGALSTYGKFEFSGGYVQIVAKTPSGPGMWPSMWMLPGPNATNGDDVEIDMFEGGYYGNGVDPLDNFSWHLHTPQGLEGGITNVGVNLSAGFHTYGLQWDPGQYMKWYFDGQLVGQVTQKQASIPVEPMELLINLAVANGASAAYRTLPNASTPTTDQFQVQKVQIYR
jgi:beta-glucanase (GH16 family)